MLKVTTSIPAEYCTPERQKRLNKAGFDTNGHIVQLELILTENGFKLPELFFDEYKRTYYRFRFENYTLMFLEYADCLAESILLLKKLEKS